MESGELVNPEFHRMACKFYVKTHELGKFWMAYQQGVDHGYSGKRLEAYCGLSIKNFRRTVVTREKVRYYGRFSFLGDMGDFPAGELTGNYMVDKIGDEYEHPGAVIETVVNSDHTGDPDQERRKERETYSTLTIRYRSNPRILLLNNEDLDSGVLDPVLFQERIEQFRRVNQRLVKLLDNWLQGKELTRAEFRKLTSAFARMKV